MEHGCSRNPLRRNTFLFLNRRSLRLLNCRLFAPSHGGIGRFDGVISSHDSAGRTKTSLPIPGKFAKDVVGRAFRVGNEGAGRVVAAGKGAAAQALKGRLVACRGTRLGPRKRVMTIIRHFRRPFSGPSFAARWASSFGSRRLRYAPFLLHTLESRV